MSQEFIALHEQHRYAISEEEANTVYDSMPEEYRAQVKRGVLVKYLTSRQRNSIYWYDYEAGGTDAKSAAVTQHAAIRTDEDLNILDMPNDWLCKLHGDKLPHPVAIALTGINPMDCVERGLPEPVFFRQILQEKSAPGTCSAGYNSMKYDEEMTRFGLWRNLLPVYRREFENGNSKWDLFTVTAALRALCPDAAVWPVDETGRVRLKLEMLATENNITQENAHNALDDVKALIDWARHIKASAPALWDYLYNHRQKRAISGKLRIGSVGQLISPFFGSENNFMSTVLFIGVDPTDANKLVYVDLCKVDALRACWSTDARTLHERLISTKDELEAQGVERPPIGSVAINKSPAFFTFDWLNSQQLMTDEIAAAQAAALPLADKIMIQAEFIDKLLAAKAMGDFDEPTDPELRLYAEGFPSTHDEKNIRVLLGESVEQAFSSEMEWDNPALAVLWQRARCKLGDSHVELTASERKQWDTHRQACLTRELEPQGKHESVNLLTVKDVLAETEMSDTLRQGYEQFLAGLST
jgi:exodeoxyribonuclease I